MKTTVVGFPRIGKNREWKKSLENYWAGKISSTTLIDEAQKLQREHISMMNTLDEVPLDFALYDHMLETSFLLGCIPQEVANTPISSLEKYFALARGLQTESIDIKAWPMKKWFATNYHYVCPRISATTSWEADFFFLEYKLPLLDGKKPFRWVIPGPYTFLKLSRLDGISPQDVSHKLLKAYERLLARLPQAIDIQLDEPALVYDMTEGDVELFLSFYQRLASRYGERLLIQTYFGDVRDVYEKLVALPVKGIGLDFVDGKTIELVENHGFPQDKLLFCGVVSGRSIWRSDYKKTITLLQKLGKHVPEKNLILSSSCSLLHLPYTTAGESFPPEIENMVCFALEKLGQLQEIALLARLSDPTKDPCYQRNQAIVEHFQNRKQNPALKERLSNLCEKDFQRSLSVEKRRELQRKNLSLPLLPTTTIGSFPQTSELRKLRKSYAEGHITEEFYKEKLREMIQSCVKIQEEMGIDVLVHGEYERNDMVEYFASFLTGFTTTRNGWVQSYGSRATKPPIIYGDILRRSPMTVEWICYAQSLTTRPVKAILTGPITIINWSFCREDIALKEVAYQIALALREEINELQQNHIRIIQVDEAALREKLPLRRSEWQSYLDVATSAFRLATSSVKPEIQLHTHMCYSEFADTIDAIEALDADVLTIEASRSDLAILNPLRSYAKKREIGPGVYDIHSPRIPSTEEIIGVIQKLLEVVPVDHLWVNPDCGLKTRTENEAYSSLRNMVQATKKLRAMLT